jgi:hypothetical protein
MNRHQGRFRKGAKGQRCGARVSIVPGVGIHNVGRLGPDRYRATEPEGKPKDDTDLCVFHRRLVDSKSSRKRSPT